MATYGQLAGKYCKECISRGFYYPSGFHCSPSLGREVDCKRRKGKSVLETTKAEEVLRRLELVKHLVDGIAVLSTRDSIQEMKEIVCLRREEEKIN